MRSFAFIVASMSLAYLVPSTSATAQTAVTTSTATSQSYVCPRCGRIHTRPVTSAQTTQLTSVTPTASPVTQTSYVPTSYSPNAGFGGGNVFSMLNSQRTRQGVPGLMYDPTLQAVAHHRAQKMAAMGVKNHPPGSFSPGRYEGVGWSSSHSPRRVSACFITDRRMRYAGAAMARGRDGVYFAVVYR